MKICITSNGPNLDSFVDPRFGRCLYFLIFDNGEVQAIENTGVNAMRGAGIQAAQTVVDAGASVVITGNMGPNSQGALSASGVKIFQARPGIKVKDALSLYEKGELQEMGQAGGLRRGRGRGRF